MTLANMIAEVEAQQMVSLGRLLAKHGMIMTGAVAEMFTARMVLCHTDAGSRRSRMCCGHSARSACRNEKRRGEAPLSRCRLAV